MTEPLWRQTDQVVRKEKFLAEHPEWTIKSVQSAGYWEAVRIDDTGQTIVTDYRLRMLLDRVEAYSRDNPPKISSK